ncbi:MAG: alpha-L-fucosidase [Clostridia bacterium]|nr:alpha-L-fucosidase [Clostridia bacterium]
MSDYIKRAALVRPTERQLAWQGMEFYAFIHFGINTFTDKEWGLGNEDPAIFNPIAFNADQWVDTCKAAGMRGLIFTCKHHDGFCLWPSKYTDHTVKNSPWRDGHGDAVFEVSEACRRGGIKFGIYLSPWDRHERNYGSGKYNEYFKNQLKELLNNYGDIFCVWFDGACGEGLNGKRQVYDWEGYCRLVREFQPSAVISVCGPDVRWCGNEAGYCRESEWSVVPACSLGIEEVQEKSQKVDNGEFSKRINLEDIDLGSREVIRDAGELIWYPAEVNTSIRPGWFYHSSEDDSVKSLEELVKIYYGSVGGNANFLLNIPPDKNGLIHGNDARRLKELGDYLKEEFRQNLAKNARVFSKDIAEETYSAEKVIDGNKNTFWCPDEGVQYPELTIAFDKPAVFNKVVLMEHIQSGQRVESFALSYKENGEWKEFYQGTVIGYKKIFCFEKILARYLKLVINQSRWRPEITSVGVF